MVWAGMMSDGNKMPLVFMPEGMKINKEVYITILKDHVLPWIWESYSSVHFTFQQDSAPAHGPRLFKPSVRQTFQIFGPSSSGRHQALISMSWTAPFSPSLRQGLVQHPTGRSMPQRPPLSRSGTTSPVKLSVLHVPSSAPVSRLALLPREAILRFEVKCSSVRW